MCVGGRITSMHAERHTVLASSAGLSPAFSYIARETEAGD